MRRSLVTARVGGAPAWGASCPLARKPARAVAQRGGEADLERERLHRLGVELAYLPGTHIPILALEQIAETEPDYLLIPPRNLKDEIMEQMEHVRSFGRRFVVPGPEVQIHG